MSYLLAIYNSEELTDDNCKPKDININVNVLLQENYKTYKDCFNCFKEGLEKYYTSFGSYWDNYKLDEEEINLSESKDYRLKNINNTLFVSNISANSHPDNSDKEIWCQYGENKYKIYKILNYGTNGGLNSDFYGFLIEKKSVNKKSKLVRDLIPEIIPNFVKEKKNIRFSIVNDNEYQKLLYEKLSEEVGEFLEDDNLEELADIYEVLEAIMKVKGFTLEELNKVKSSKKLERGGFDEKILMEVHDE